LLRYAVDIAPAQQYFAGIDADDVARRKQLLQQAHGRAVMAFVEQWHHHAPVGDVEIDVGGG
jgi:hypothetical protein